MVTLAVGWVALELRFPVEVVGLILGLQFASNLWLASKLNDEQTPFRALGSIALLDVALLTALMLATGGPSNPFTITYLVFITLAATTLDARWTWTITLASIAGYGSLFISPLRLAVDPHAGHVAMPPAIGHQVGMWAAFLVAAILTASFVTRIREAVEAREQELAEARRVAAQRERLAQLTTLAAGAAHELATPLSTIAVMTQDLVMAADQQGVPADIGEDARLIRSQVERCRDILDQMSGRADASAADPATPVDLPQVMADAIDALPTGTASRVLVEISGDPSAVLLPRVGIARVLTTLIKNALDASAPPRPVAVTAQASSERLTFSVRDTGDGMDATTLARAGEPFFTTKPSGSGFGLGLFLARTFVEQWGGQLSLVSQQGHGTEVLVSFGAEGSRV